MIRAAVDRIEGEWLILVPDNGPVFQVPVSVFSGFKDGDIVVVNDQLVSSEQAPV